MDSPAEFGAFDLRTFTVARRHAQAGVSRGRAPPAATAASSTASSRDVEKIVREARNVFGEFAPFDGNTYTFLADYLPWANGDGMEHRNSTVITSASSIRGDRADLLDTVAHEFFHSWNVERIRPASLEPFNLEDANISGELWFAEGFTSYYAPLVTTRAGLTNVREFAQEMGRAVNAVLTGPGRQVRTAEEMSQHAPFVDAATVDRPHQLRQHVHLLLHLGRGDRAGSRPVAARAIERTRHAGRAACARCGRCTASPAGRRPATWTSPTRWTT